MPSVENADLYGNQSYGLPPYGTPPPFPSQVFLDGAKAPEQSYEEITSALRQRLDDAKEEARDHGEPFKVDQHRIDVSTSGTELVLDATPLGDIVVVPNTATEPVLPPLVFTAPVKALKAPNGDLLIIRQIQTDDGVLEWPVATFREWAYVYRADFIK